MLQPRRPAHSAIITAGGILFGCLFVVVGTVVETLRQGPLDLSSILLVQRTVPLLWLVDIMPLVLGVATAHLHPPRPFPHQWMQRLVMSGLLALTLLPLLLLLGAASIVCVDRQRVNDMAVVSRLDNDSHYLTIELLAGQHVSLEPELGPQIRQSLWSLIARYPAEVAAAERAWETVQRQITAAGTVDAAVVSAWIQSIHHLSKTVERPGQQSDQLMLAALMLGSLCLLLSFIGGMALIFRWRATATALIDSEARFKQLADMTVEGVAVTVDGAIVDANRAFGDLFRYAPVELIGMRAERLTTAEAWAYIQRRLAAGADQQYQTIGLRKGQYVKSGAK